MVSVKDKINAIKKEIATIDAGAKQIQGKISKQKDINRAAVKEIDAGAKAVEGKIRKQEQINSAAVKAIGNKVTGLVGDIKKTANNFKDYIHAFYFGKSEEE